jgi:hypothetical protein
MVVPPAGGLVDVLERAERIADLADRASAIGADHVAALLRLHAARHVAYAAGMVGGLATVATRIVRAAGGPAAARSSGRQAGDAGGTSDSARSASAVIVSDGFTPGLADTLDPSTTKSPG